MSVYGGWRGGWCDLDKVVMEKGDFGFREVGMQQIQSHSALKITEFVGTPADHDAPRILLVGWEVVGL